MSKGSGVIALLLGILFWAILVSGEDEAKCGACKLTVKLYTEAVKAKGRKDTDKDRFVNHLFQKVCEDDAFNSYAPGWKEMCEQLSVTHAEDFKLILSKKADMINNEDRVAIAKEICETADVCSPASFDFVSSTPPKKMREKKCKACSIIVKEIDSLKNSGLLEKRWVGKSKKTGKPVILDVLKDVLRHGSFCADLSYYYHRGQWLEDICVEHMDDDLIEDVLDGIREGTLCEKVFECRPGEADEL